MYFAPEPVDLADFCFINRFNPSYSIPDSLVYFDTRRTCYPTCKRTINERNVVRIQILILITQYLYWTISACSPITEFQWCFAILRRVAVNCEISNQHICTRLRPVEPRLYPVVFPAIRTIPRASKASWIPSRLPRINSRSPFKIGYISACTVVFNCNLTQQEVFVCGYIRA